MSSENLNIALGLLLALINRAQRVSALIVQRAAEGGLTDADLDTLTAENDQARQELRDAIERAREEGR